jgi:formate/nitrite transporter FocA (FNT family)
MIWVFIGGLSGGLLLSMGLFYWGIVRHRRIPSLTKYVIFSISVLLIYTITELVLVAYKETSHDTLTTCVYACFGGEILSCALIKIFKLKEENRDE